MFTMVNHNNDFVESITRFKLFSPSSVLAKTLVRDSECYSDILNHNVRVLLDQFCID